MKTENKPLEKVPPSAPKSEISARGACSKIYGTGVNG